MDVWPNSISSANSDPWLAANHDTLREIRPRVLVLNFYNGTPGNDVLDSVNARIKALGEASRYHGYLDPGAPRFVNYEVAAIVDYTDPDPLVSDFGSSSRVPVGVDGVFDVEQLFGPSFAFPDPAGTDAEFGLCELFEMGAINEVWLAVADERQPPLMVERKQLYDQSMTALPGEFNDCIRNADNSCLDDVECDVTVRLAHLNPRRGTGCDLQVRGWSIVDTVLSIPYFADNATAFFNADLRERFGVSFDSFADICEPMMPCVSYPSSDVAESDGVPFFQFEPYRQGCGTPEFPPNASTRYDWNEIMTSVSSRCEHYGMRDGADGQDAYELYDASKLAVYDDLMPEDDEFPGDCGGGWQVYWRQSMPGLDNEALGADGKPMKNWWPFMFY